MNIDNYISLAIEHNLKLDYKKIFKNIYNLEELLNYYLNNIIKVYSPYKYKYMNYSINLLYNNSICNSKLLKNEASIISDDLIEKITNKNNRNITLPLSIKLLEEYSITSLINKKDISIVIKLIILKLAITNYFLNM